jgi:hypothetical protein
MPTSPPVRIAVEQSIATKAKQALMIGSQELRLFAYRHPYHLGHVDQREVLLETLHGEFKRSAALPPKSVSSRLVVYLVVAEGEPLLIPENDVLPWVFAYALAKGGRAAAARVSYRPDMLTT